MAAVRARLRDDTGDDVRLSGLISPADGDDRRHRGDDALASLILTAPVVLYSAALSSATFRDVRLRRLGMDVPVALGIGAAFIASAGPRSPTAGRGVFRLGDDVRVLPLCGRRQDAGPAEAVRDVEELGRYCRPERLAAWPARGRAGAGSQLQWNDVIRVKPGETVPADGS